MLSQLYKIERNLLKLIKLKFRFNIAFPVQSERVSKKVPETNITPKLVDSLFNVWIP